MRTIAALMLLPVLAAPVAAQDFEGMIAMKMTSTEMSGPLTMKMYLTSTRQAMVMEMPADAGPMMAGKEMRMVVDPGAGKVTMLMPAPPGMPAKGMKMVLDMSSIGEQAQAQIDDVKVTPLGTTQTVLGMKCEDYEVVTDEEKVKICVTDKLGRYSFPELNGMRAEMPGWAKAFGNKPAFPLKVWTDDGSMSMEITAIERGPVAAEILNDNPEGFMSMPGMGG